MFVFSEVHDWQGDPSVKQLLVFPSLSMKNAFDQEMEVRKERHFAAGGDLSTLNDSNAGAIYKLRAVRNHRNEWIPILRCGVTGHQALQEGPAMKTVAQAFTYLRVKLVEHITEAFEVLTADLLKIELQKFPTFTTKWFLHPSNPRLAYTEGVRFFVENAGGGNNKSAFWLIDFFETRILPMQKSHPFLVVVLTVKNNIAAVEVTDSNGIIVLHVYVFHIDCLPGEWKFYLVHNEDVSIMALSSEH